MHMSGFTISPHTHTHTHTTPHHTTSQEKGLLLVTPEHRLSLQLKGDELWGPDSCCENKLDQLDDFHYVDIVDESDMVLSSA